MDKYTMLQDIKNTIQKIENYQNEMMVFPHLTGIMAAWLTDEQMEKIYSRLIEELEMKEISDELKYEMEAGK